MPNALIRDTESRLLAKWLLDEIDAERAEWVRERHAVKAAAEYCCERCALPCYRPGEEILDRRYLIAAVRAENHPDRPLVAWCIPCHLKINAQAFRQRALWRERVKYGQLSFEAESASNV